MTEDPSHVGAATSAPASDEGILRRSRRRRPVEDWALVLVSQGMHPTVSRSPRGYLLDVPGAERAHARALLDAYDAENRPARRTRPLAPVDPRPLRSAALAAASLLAFFLVTGPPRPASPWFERGGADAAKVFGPEPWRAVTALTLHVDGAHVVSNALVGAIFWSAVSRSLGAGLALAWIVAAGALGNLANAWAHADAHESVGASTAVFGALGILGGLGVRRRLQLGLRGRHAWVPVAAGLGLLAMLGTGGERVDLWAHAFGLAAGILCGIAAGALTPLRPGPVWQWSGGLAGCAAIVTCWWLALH